MTERWKELLGELADEQEVARFQEELEAGYMSRADALAQAAEAEQGMAQRESRIAELEGEMAQRDVHITQLESQMAQIRLDATVEAALIRAGAKNVRAARALLDLQSLADAEEALPLLEEQIARMQESDGYLFKQQDTPWLTAGNFARKHDMPDQNGLTYSQAIRLGKRILN